MPAKSVKDIQLNLPAGTDLHILSAATHSIADYYPFLAEKLTMPVDFTGVRLSGGATAFQIAQQDADGLGELSFNGS